VPATAGLGGIVTVTVEAAILTAELAIALLAAALPHHALVLAGTRTLAGECELRASADAAVHSTPYRGSNGEHADGEHERQADGSGDERNAVTTGGWCSCGRRSRRGRGRDDRLGCRCGFRD
jgi:hypothetical protein